MSSSTVFPESQVLVFDTGPLWELILYSAVRPPLGFASLRSGLRYLQSDPMYQRLSEFVASFQRRTTTPHVVAEISSWIIRTERKGQSAIWSLVYNEFQSMGMDESLLKLLEMPRALVAAIGAVDASILELGKGLEQPKPLVLSIDGALIAECRRAGISAKHLWEVIA
jgi:hypothetical protein